MGVERSAFTPRPSAHASGATRSLITYRRSPTGASVSLRCCQPCERRPRPAPWQEDAACIFRCLFHCSLTLLIVAIPTYDNLFCQRLARRFPASDAQFNFTCALANDDAGRLESSQTMPLYSHLPRKPPFFYLLFTSAFSSAWPF